MNLRRCLWCLLPRSEWHRSVVVPAGTGLDGTGYELVPCSGARAFRAAGDLLELAEADYSVAEFRPGCARQRHDARRLVAGLRRLDARAAVHGWLCEGCENRGAEFDPVGAVQRGEVIL